MRAHPARELPLKHELHPCRLGIALAAALVVAGCGSSDETDASAGVGASGAGGGAIAEEGCPPGEVTLEDGSCRPAGVPPDACAAGFEAEDHGCVAVVPSEPCDAGLTALPGDAACREVSPCGEAPFGDAPDSPTTQYVDGAYGGMDSDGSQDRPWITIQQGIDAAADGAIVAVAAGSYTSFIADHPVTVRGRCASLVEVVGQTTDDLAAYAGAPGVTVQDLALTGEGFGLVTNAEGAVAERVWIHHTGHVGAYVGTPGSLELRDSLIEEAGEIGCASDLADVVLDRTEVRRTRPNAVGGYGIGVVLINDAPRPQSLVVRSSRIEGNHDHGIAVIGGQATIEATLVRGTQPNQGDQLYGRGISVGLGPDPSAPASLALRSSVIEDSYDVGVYLQDADATVEATVVRATQPSPQGIAGRGIGTQRTERVAYRATLDVRDSVVEDCHDAGISLVGADGSFAGIVVRRTRAAPVLGQGRAIDIRLDPGVGPSVATLVESVIEGSDTQAIAVHGGTFDVVRTAVRGNGIITKGFAAGLVYQDEEGQPATGSVRDSLFENNFGGAVSVVGSDVTMERTKVHDTLPDASGLGGVGVVVQVHQQTGIDGRLTSLDTTIERSREVGVMVVGSEAWLERVTVTDTATDADGSFGDGIAVAALDGRGLATITGARVTGSARAGISSFGGDVVLSDSTLDCNAIHLDAESQDGETSSFVDDGGNACGCAGVDAGCKVSSANLTAPSALPP